MIPFMTIGPRHDRIFPLKDLTCYPGSDYLDLTIFLPWSKDPMRRVWLMAPEGAPRVGIDDTLLNPVRVLEQEPRWVDYGPARLPIIAEPNWALGEFHQLRIHGMEVSQCAASHLVVTPRLDLLLDGCSIEEAQRRLWGLARCDAGTTTLRPARLAAGSATDFVVRYAAGPQGLPPGALVRFAIPHAFSLPQTDDPTAPGYLALEQSDAQVTVVAIGQSIEAHEKIDVTCRVEDGLAPFAGFCLRYVTERMFLFTNAYHEIDRRYWYSQLPPCAAAVAMSEGSPFVALEEANSHVFELVPGPSERLHLFLPGRRFATDPLSLRGTFTDRYRNVPPSGPIDADLELYLLSDDERIPLGTPAEHFRARHRFELPLPPLASGVYRAVACRHGTLDEVARSNPMEIVDRREGMDRLYWGEIHGHTEMSDGSGDYWELYRHAQDEGCLDFTAATDHAEYVTDNQWLWMQDVTNAWNDPPRFVTLIGHEWEGRERDRCIYTARSRLELQRGNYGPTNSLQVVWGRHHDDEQVVGGPHATLAHRTVLEHHDPCVERFAEIYSMWGACDLRDSPLAAPWLEEGKGVTVNDLLRRGAKLGFTGGGDCHDGRCGFASEDLGGQGITPHTFAYIILFRCGMTAALMPCLDRASLIRAIRDRRTYATTGARILLEFSAAGYPMGSIGQAGDVECCATVHAVQPIRRIEIVKDGQVAWSGGCGGRDADVRWQDPGPPRAEHYYYLHVLQVDGHQAWSSPVWVHPPEG